MLARNETNIFLDSIRREARLQAGVDKSPDPMFQGARNTFEERVYNLAYRTEFARLLELETKPHIDQ